jgi:two-component system sensor histidine kinase MprB
MTLRAKIILALASIATVATVVVGFSSYRTTRVELQAAVDDSLTQAARIVVPNTDPGRPGRPDRGLEGVVVQRLDATGAVVSNSAQGGGDEDDRALPVGEVELALATQPGQLGLGVFRSVQVDGVPYRMLTVRVPGGAVQVARSTADSEAALDSIRNRTLVIVVLVVLASVMAGWFIGTSLTRRLTRLSAAAGEVAATGRLDVPMPTDGVDETAQVARSMRTMLDALATSRDQQQQLIQDTGHELRTPLTSMRTNLQVLARFDDLDAPTRAAILADLDSEARELSTLVEEVLALATDRYVDEPAATVSVGALAERVAVRARRRSGRDIVVHQRDTEAEVRPAAIERAISNLVDNAVKFAPDGPIEISVAGTDGWLDVAVRDHGPGIDPAEAPRLFDRFHRSVSARSTPGSGLGLAIVATTVEQHGGTVAAVNAEGGGAQIGFRIRRDGVGLDSAGDRS